MISRSVKAIPKVPGALCVHVLTGEQIRINYPFCRCLMSLTHFFYPKFDPINFLRTIDMIIILLRHLIRVCLLTGWPDSASNLDWRTFNSQFEIGFKAMHLSPYGKNGLIFLFVVSDFFSRFTAMLVTIGRIVSKARFHWIVLQTVFRTAYSDDKGNSYLQGEPLQIVFIKLVPDGL